MASGIVLATSHDDNITFLTPPARPYTVVTDSSLYQLAMQSDVTVLQLRAINRGSLDRRETLKAGESLLLPATSPLFTHENTDTPIPSNLPELGMGNAPVPKGSPSVEEMKAIESVQLVGRQNWNDMTSDQAKEQAEGLAKGWANSLILSPLQKKTQDLLEQFGKAQLNLNVDDKGRLKNTTASLFTPWYENDEITVFSQLGVHSQDTRTIGNIGTGIRFDRIYWLWGVNVFLDQDISRAHTRGAVGAELWADNLKFAANYYRPLSGWKDSKDFDDYLERPAEGFDVRMQGYLPAYPQLGASAVYEQYFGDEVALFGKDNLQKNPYAVTLGIDYTPISLLTLKISHKQGQSGKSENNAELQLNYQLGTPLKMQLDPDAVIAARSLKGSRHDLVDRNYDIVLEYKEKDGLFELDLASVPSELLEGDNYIMQPLVNSKYRITEVTWNGDVKPLSIVATQGVDNPQGWSITLPAWDSNLNATNRYHLSITLANEKGRRITSNTVEVVVGQHRQGILELEGQGEKPASGLAEDAIRLASYLIDHQGKKISDPTLVPKWIVKDTAGGVVPVVKGDSCPIDEQGRPKTCVREKLSEIQVREGITHYIRELVSTVAAEFIVVADLGSYGISKAQKITFTANSAGMEVASAQILDSKGNDILSTHNAPLVGNEYTVKLFNAAGEDITALFPPEQLRWHLTGKGGLAGCDQSPGTEDTGVTGTRFTPRINSVSNSGVNCGDQGYGLKIVY